MTLPQFHALFAQCKTKTQALGCCIEMLSQDGSWSGMDPESFRKLVLPHKEAFKKMLEKQDARND